MKKLKVGDKIVVTKVSGLAACFSGLRGKIVGYHNHPEEHIFLAYRVAIPGIEGIVYLLPSQISLDAPSWDEETI